MERHFILHAVDVGMNWPFVLYAVVFLVGGSLFLWLLTAAGTLPARILRWMRTGKWPRRDDYASPFGR